MRHANLCFFKLARAGFAAKLEDDLGEAVKADADVFMIADLSSVWVEIMVYADDVSRVSAGQSVTALVTKVDPVEQKISLSIRALTNKEERAALKRFAAQEAASQTTTLGDLLKEKLGRKSEE